MQIEKQLKIPLFTIEGKENYEGYIPTPAIYINIENGGNLFKLYIYRETVGRKPILIERYTFTNKERKTMERDPFQFVCHLNQLKEVNSFFIQYRLEGDIESRVADKKLTYHPSYFATSQL